MGCGCGSKPDNRTNKQVTKRYIYNPSTVKVQNGKTASRRRTIKRPAR